MLIGKGEIELYLFTDDMIVYVEIWQNDEKNPIGIKNNYIKVVRETVNIQKSVPNISSEQLEFETKNSIYIASKKMKYVAINLEKYV